MGVEHATVLRLCCWPSYLRLCGTKRLATKIFSSRRPFNQITTVKFVVFRQSSADQNQGNGKSRLSPFSI